MGRQNYLPRSDADLLNWTTPLAAGIAAAPQSFGLTEADAAQLSALREAFNSALRLATDPLTRTTPNVVAKNHTRDQLCALVRSIVRRIRANPAVSDPARSSLGLPIPDVQGTPQPPPATRPVLSLRYLSSAMHLIHLHDESTPTRRAKPIGVAGAEIYVFVGQNPPGELENWKPKGLATRSSFRITYAPAEGGQMATILARWFNHKGQFGPLSHPLLAPIPASLVAAA